MPTPVHLPRLWYSPGGSEKLWGDQGTYTAVEFEKLPPLSVDGSFRWLTAVPPHEGST